MAQITHTRDSIVAYSTLEEELNTLKGFGEKGLRVIERVVIRDEGPFGGKIWYVLALANTLVNYEYEIDFIEDDPSQTFAATRIAEKQFLDKHGADGWLLAFKWIVPRTLSKSSNGGKSELQPAKTAYLFIREVAVEVEADLKESAKTAVTSGNPADLRAIARKLEAARQAANMKIINGDEIDRLSRFVVDAAGIQGWKSPGKELKKPDAEPVSPTTAPATDEPITFSEFSPGEL